MNDLTRVALFENNKIFYWLDDLDGWCAGFSDLRSQTSDIWLFHGFV
jgi:hypothetical protein